MGVRRDVYAALRGFSRMRFGEDVDFSYRIFEHGYTARLFPSAWVWHKRRTDLDKFFKQVFNSGIARINLTKRHPGTLKLIHLLPAAFTVASSRCWPQPSCCACSTPMRHPPPPSISGYGHCCPILLFIVLIFVDATRVSRSTRGGLPRHRGRLCPAHGYGLGFLKAWWQRYVMGRSEFSAFEKNFYD
jgi:GT2 family glycosyltransferase